MVVVSGIYASVTVGVAGFGAAFHDKFYETYHMYRYDRQARACTPFNLLFHMHIHTGLVTAVSTREHCGTQ